MIPEGWKCPRRTGFLFPHECDRLTPIGCPDCNGGQVNDPFHDRTDRYGYGGYDDYGRAGIAGSQMDFTEADGQNLIRTRKRYEDDMTAS